MQKFNKQAFTLMELIVVVFLLMILSTIVIMSFGWYASDSRDTTRVVDIRNITLGLELRLEEKWVVPIPEDKINISIASKKYINQWYIWHRTLRKIWIKNWWKDPLDDTFYTYWTNASLSRFQILWFVEDKDVSFIWESYALEEKKVNIYPYSDGHKVWILFKTWSLIPLQSLESNIDLKYTSEDYTMYFDNSDKWKVTWKWKDIIAGMASITNPVASCKKILETEKNKLFPKTLKNGRFFIDPMLEWGYEVDCDMETDWWWWTKVLFFDETHLAYDIVWQDRIADITWNYSYLYSFKDKKNNAGKYEFIVDAYWWSTKRSIRFIQDNSYLDDPIWNNFTEVWGWSLEIWFTIGTDTNRKWLAIWNYWNNAMKSNCSLWLSYWHINNTNWRTCAIDQVHNNYWIWPLYYTFRSPPPDRIDIWQRW